METTAAELALSDSAREVTLDLVLTQLEPAEAIRLPGPTLWIPDRIWHERPPKPKTLGLLQALNPFEEGGIWQWFRRGTKYAGCIEERKAVKEPFATLADRVLVLLPPSTLPPGLDGTTVRGWVSEGFGREAKAPRSGLVPGRRWGCSSVDRFQVRLRIEMAGGAARVQGGGSQVCAPALATRWRRSAGWSLRALVRQLPATDAAAPGGGTSTGSSGSQPVGSGRQRSRAVTRRRGSGKQVPCG